MDSTQQTKYPTIILFGPPGSGKGTQAHLIFERFQLPNISVGSSVRQFALANNHPDSADYKLAQKIKKLLESGELLDFEDIKYILESDIKKAAAQAQPFLIEGLPRSAEQAVWLTEFFDSNQVNCLFVHFYLDQEQTIQRLKHRYYVPGDETPYSSYAEAKNKCSADQEPVRRDDDTNEEIIRKRYYEQYAKPQQQILDSMQKCRSVKIVEVNASPAAEEIFSKIVEYFQKYVF